MVRPPVFVVLLVSVAFFGPVSFSEILGSHAWSGGGAFDRLWAGELSALPTACPTRRRPPSVFHTGSPSFEGQQRVRRVPQAACRRR